jgi:hypothetical protein
MEISKPSLFSSKLIPSAKSNSLPRVRRRLRDCHVALLRRQLGRGPTMSAVAVAVAVRGLCGPVWGPARLGSALGLDPFPFWWIQPCGSRVEFGQDSWIYNYISEPSSADRNVLVT